MRRLFGNKQAQITPYEDPGPVSRRISDDNEHRQRAQAGDVYHADPNNDSYANLAHKNNYSAYGEVHTARKGKHGKGDANHSNRASAYESRYAPPPAEGEPPYYQNDLLAPPQLTRDDGETVERAQDRYIDENDVAEQRFSARTGNKDRVKRMLLGLRRQRAEPGSDLLESHSNSSASELDERQQSGRTSPSKREHGSTAWLTGLGKAPSTPSRSTQNALVQHLQDLCAHDELHWDEAQLLPLFEAVRRSDANSKDAARALRKELKHGLDQNRQRAIKLVALLYVHTGDRFRLQVANKRFLEVLEDVYSNKKTSTRTRGRLLVALSMLAFESQHDADLFPITKTYNKIKPAEMPVNGVAIDADSDLLQIQATGGNDAFYAPYEEGGGRTLNDHAEDVATARPLDVFEQQTAQPTPDSAAAEYEAFRSEAVRKMHQECNVARSNAHLLSETLIEHGLASDLLSEFAEKTTSSNEFLASQIPWITAQAEESRATLLSQHPGAVIRTADEALLDDLLDAHEKVSAALAMLQQAQDRQREEDEEARVLDRSMREMRMDRSALRHDPMTGDVYHLSDSDAQRLDSGSRSVSPARRPLPDISKHVAAKQSFLAPPMQASISVQSAPSTMSSSPTPEGVVGRHKLTSVGNINTDVGFDPDDGSSIVTPVVPSQKALGKRRAFSNDVQDVGGAALDVESDEQGFRESSLLARPPPALPR